MQRQFRSIYVLSWAAIKLAGSRVIRTASITWISIGPHVFSSDVNRKWYILHSLLHSLPFILLVSCFFFFFFFYIEQRKNWTSRPISPSPAGTFHLGTYHKMDTLLNIYTYIHLYVSTDIGMRHLHDRRTRKNAYDLVNLVTGEFVVELPAAPVPNDYFFLSSFVRHGPTFSSPRIHDSTWRQFFFIFYFRA